MDESPIICMHSGKDGDFVPDNRIERIVEAERAAAERRQLALAHQKSRLDDLKKSLAAELEAAEQTADEASAAALEHARGDARVLVEEASSSARREAEKLTSAGEKNLSRAAEMICQEIFGL